MLALSLMFLLKIKTSPYPQNDRRQCGPLVIVKFSLLCARDALYKARSRLKNFTIEDIGFGSQGGNDLYLRKSYSSKEVAVTQM